MEEVFPRDLTERERDLLFWVLPADRPGYKVYRELIGEWKIAGQGRRGTGNYVIAPAGEQIDNESPLPQVLAYGQVETTRGTITVTVRERLGNQIEYEIAALGQGDLVDGATEIRRWTYSVWLPDQTCPICSKAVRKVGMSLASGRTLVLAICPADKKLWIYDNQTGISHPIPVTNFYNELMVHKNIRDPQKALAPKKLFEDIGEYSDQDLAHAFRTYNQLRTKVYTAEAIVLEENKPPTFFKRIFSRLKDR